VKEVLGGIGQFEIIPTSAGEVVRFTVALHSGSLSTIPGRIGNVCV